MILHDTDIITRNHLPVEFGKPAAKIDESPGILDQQGHAITVSDDGIDLAEIEKEFIKQALVTAKGNKTRAAKLLRITRDALRYRIQKLNV
jgi:transcriptional regulator with PAS, ATPase and Fis domain